jgi:hypothetical protein
MIQEVCFLDLNSQGRIPLCIMASNEWLEEHDAGISRSIDLFLPHLKFKLSPKADCPGCHAPIYGNLSFTPSNFLQYLFALKCEHEL